VTETAVITHRARPALHRRAARHGLPLRARRLRRGLSSFANLKNLSLDYLKIDGYFIRNLASDNVNQAMVTAMIKLARSRQLPGRRRARRGLGRTRLGAAHGRGLPAGLPDGPPAAAAARELRHRPARSAIVAA